LNTAPKPSGLLQASGLLFGMIMAANATNYLFHMLASRALGPADYGSLVSMIAVLTVLIFPSQAVQAVVAKAVAVEELHHRFDRVAALGGRALVRVFLLGSALSLALWLTGAYWQKFFHLGSFRPLLAVGVAAVCCLVLTVARGLLQGLQRFGLLGANYLADGLLRLAAGAVFFGVGWKVAAGISAYGLSATAALLLAFIPLAGLRRERTVATAELELPRLYRYGLPVLISFSAFAVLTSLDVILVKHYFQPVPAGYYSAASIIGRAFLFLPLAMAQVLFPKASAGHAQEEKTLGLLNQSLLLTAAALAAGVLVAWVLAPFIVLTLFGAQFVQPQTLNLARWFGLAISPLALVYVVMQYNLAVHRTRFAWLLVGDIPLLLLGLVCCHGSLLQVLLVLGGNHSLLLGVGYAFTLRDTRREVGSGV